MEHIEMIQRLLSALEYHAEQTRPIQSTTTAIQAAREHLQQVNGQAAKPGAITEAMAFAFHSAITDGALGSDDLMDIMRGLEAAFAHITGPQAPTQQPVKIGPLARRRIFDYIRGAYDLGYNDARNAKAVPGDGAPGYKGRDVEADHGGALLHALEALGAQTTQQPLTDEIQWPSARDVGRYGDMSPHAHLRIGLDSDNDVYVHVWGDDGGASVEFCTGGGGGGSSPATRAALIALMCAIEADNAARPDKDWWARRNGITRSKEGGAA